MDIILIDQIQTVYVTRLGRLLAKEHGINLFVLMNVVLVTKSIHTKTESVELYFLLGTWTIGIVYNTIIVKCFLLS